MTPTNEEHDVDLSESSDEAPEAETEPADADASTVAPESDAQTDASTEASTEKPKDEDAPAPLGTVESWAQKHGTKDWLFAGAKAGERWAVGQELTEAAYLAAIKTAANVSCR